MDYLTIFIIILFVWIIILYYVKIKKTKYFQLYGPALMVKTERGKRFLERLSKNLFWKYFGTVSIYITIVAMILTIILLFWEATLVPLIPKSSAPSPLTAIGIPGINPIIPVTYGIVAIVVAVVIHEFSHGIVALRNKINVKSIGALFFIIPIGAFVEPDEKELEESDKKIRMRVFSAGPSSNIVVSIIFLILFFLLVSQVSVPMNNPVVTYSGNAKLNAGDILISIDNITINNINVLDSMNMDPGKVINLTLVESGKIVHRETIAGVYITSVLQNTPAYYANIKPGYIVESINNHVIRNVTSFTDILYSYKPGDSINITFITNNGLKSFNVTLVDKYDYYAKYSPISNNISFIGKPFLGVGVSYLNATFADPNQILSSISNPFQYGLTRGILILIAYPFNGLSPVPDYFNYIFNTPFSPFIFWPMVNLFYWIFWLDLMLGLTNVLPMIPLDGGYVFKDLISGIAEKMKINNERLNNYVNATVATVSIIILFLILWQFIGPRI